MPQAKLISNEDQAVVVNLTPTVAFTGGDVIPVSSGCFITHRDLPANTLGAASLGGAVYDIDKVSGVNTDYTNGVKAYWNQTVSGAVSLATGNKFLGLGAQSVGVSDTKWRIAHGPPAAP